jgi:hypothetical protein
VVSIITVMLPSSAYWERRQTTVFGRALFRGSSSKSGCQSNIRVHTRCPVVLASLVRCLAQRGYAETAGVWRLSYDSCAPHSIFSCKWRQNQASRSRSRTSEGLHNERSAFSSGLVFFSEIEVPNTIPRPNLRDRGKLTRLCCEPVFSQERRFFSFPPRGVSSGPKNWPFDYKFSENATFKCILIGSICIGSRWLVFKRRSKCRPSAVQAKGISYVKI